MMNPAGTSKYSVEQKTSLLLFLNFRAFEVGQQINFFFVGRASHTLEHNHVKKIG